MNAYQWSLALHIGAGTLALLSFWAAGLIKKGTPRHRRIGQIYLLAMAAVLVSGVPLVLGLSQRGQSVGALFLTFLLLLTGTGCWNAWRAIRDRRDRRRYFGPTYWILLVSCALAGMGIIALGLQTGAVLLQVFGGIGVVAFVGSVRSYRASANDPSWWMKEHYGAMIGNGVATHIAFFGIGLRNALPFVDPQLLQLFAWLSPVVGAAIATVWLQRKYGRRPSASRPRAQIATVNG